jgi:O-antigen ligase
VLASLSRGGMISTAASLAFILLLGLRARRYREGRQHRSRLATALARAVPAIAIALLIAAGVFWIGADPILERVSGNPPASSNASFYDSRGWVWRDTLQMIRTNPITGVGLGAYGTAFSLYTTSDGSLRVPQAHNDFLQIVADGGIVGGLLALWFLVLLFRAIADGMKARDPLMAGMSLGCGASAFALLVHSVFDFNLQVPSNALLFLLLATVAAQVAAAVRAPRNAANPVSRASRRTAGEDAPATSIARGAS